VRRLVCITIIVLLALMAPWLGARPSGAYPPDPGIAAAEQVLLDQLNRDRVAAGLAPAAADAYLADLARQQAQRMRDAGYVFHNEQLHLEVPRPWGSIAENVAWGPTLAVVEQIFMGSGPHRDNILGAYDRVGVGVAVAGDVIYVSEVFVHTG
jgi:uncharacterized protein YkwD